MIRLSESLSLRARAKKTFSTIGEKKYQVKYQIAKEPDRLTLGVLISAFQDTINDGVNRKTSAASGRERTLA